MSLMGASVIAETGVTSIEEGASIGLAVAGTLATAVAGLAIGLREIGQLHAEA